MGGEINVWRKKRFAKAHTASKWQIWYPVLQTTRFPPIIQDGNLPGMSRPHPLNSSVSAQLRWTVPLPVLIFSKHLCHGLSVFLPSCFLKSTPYWLCPKMQGSSPLPVRNESWLNNVPDFCPLDGQFRGAFYLGSQVCPGGIELCLSQK